MRRRSLSSSSPVQDSQLRSRGIPSRYYNVSPPGADTMAMHTLSRSAVVAVSLFALLTACQTDTATTTVKHADDPAIAIGESDLGGVVTSANGPEAGVWVI